MKCSKYETIQSFCRKTWGKEAFRKAETKIGDNTKIDLMQVGSDDEDCVIVAQDRTNGELIQGSLKHK